MRNLLYMPHTIQSPIFDNLPIQDLIKFRTLSKHAFMDVQEYYKRTMGPSALYGKAFPNEQECIAFRAVLREAGAIVSSFALVYILSRRPPRPAIIYVYLPSNYVSKLGGFLSQKSFNYEPLPAKVVDKQVLPAQAENFQAAVEIEHRRQRPNTGHMHELCDDSTISGVFCFTKKDQSIYVVGTRTEPFEVILSFHSTLFMNIATADQFVSLYPKTSFVDQQALILKDLSPLTRSAIETFESDGWSTFNMSSAIRSLDPGDELSHRTRWVGDDHCWTTAPNQHHANSEQYRSFEVSSWQLACPGIDSTIVTHERLEHRFFSQTYPLTWEAERAVWAHPCFFDLDPNNAAEDGDSDAGASIEDSDLSDGDSETSVTTTASLLESVEAEMAQCKYVVTTMACTHRAINTEADIEPAMVDFLRGFYPLMQKAGQTNRNMLKMKMDFIALHDNLPDSANAITFPTGHAVNIILQHVEDIRRSGRCPSVKYTLNFTLGTFTNKISTACVIEVPEAALEKIEAYLAEVSVWTEQHLVEAGVIIRLVAKKDSEDYR
ncbi:hypothetical protein VNI00_011121 [Paramarasmius palmivorus]|uniref:F-box domain-containing protein n=1 Tax=Paramarasmius palmivorus TaxID=297713 RepID=A0AAW0CFI7_9AGAR